MNKQKAEQIVTEYLKKLYGFSLGKTTNLQDAEDLTQDIALKLYNALITSDIYNVNAFVWRIARNTLANYYRGKARNGIGVPLDDIDELLKGDDDDPAESMTEAETIIVWIQDNEIKGKLIEIGDKIKEKYKAEFDKLKAPYIKAVMDNTPEQLKKMQAYGMQYIFHSDGWFLLYCAKELINNGKLKLPTEEQKKSLSTIIMPK